MSFPKLLSNIQGSSPKLIILVSFVVSLNLKRRHLTSSQKATIAVEIEPALAEEARKRQIDAGEKFGEKYPKAVVSKSEELSQIIEQPLKPKSNDNKAAHQAAELTHTNRQYVSFL